MVTNPNWFLLKNRKKTTTPTGYTQLSGWVDWPVVKKWIPLDTWIKVPSVTPTQPKPVEVQAPAMQQPAQTNLTPTKTNPIIVQEAKPTQVGGVDYSQVDNMDTNSLQRYVDEWQVKATMGEEIPTAERMKLLAASRKLATLTSPTTVESPYEAQIKTQEQQRAEREAQLKAQEEAMMSAEERRLNAIYAERSRQAQEAGERTADAGKTAMSFSGLGRSTFNADQQTRIQQSVESNLAALNEEKFTALERYRAEQAGASAEALASYDQRINTLRDKQAQFQLQQADQINKYNQDSAASYQDKINNLMAYAQSWTDPNAQLTEQDLATAKAYWQIAIDKDGNINTALLKEIDPKLMSEVIKSAAETRGAIPTNEFWFINVGGWLVAITDPTTGEVRYEQWQVPKEYSLEKIGDTGYVFDPTTWATVQAWTTIDRQTATSKYWSTPAVRNFNPWNIMDTWFGGQKVAGERFTRFDTPQQWFNALVAKIQNIQAGNSKVYSPDMTLTQYMSKYAPASDNNNPQAYANQVAKFLWVPVWTTIWQIDPVKLAEAHAKHEDGNSYQMLKDLWIFGWLTQWTTQWSWVTPESQAWKEKSQELVNRIDRIKTALNNKLLPRWSALLDPDIAADVDYIKNNLMLKTFAEAKASWVTFGAASNAEWEALKNAATSIKWTMSKDALTTELDRLKTAAWWVWSTATTSTITDWSGSSKKSLEDLYLK